MKLAKPKFGIPPWLEGFGGIDGVKPGTVEGGQPIVIEGVRDIKETGV